MGSGSLLVGFRQERVLFMSSLFPPQMLVKMVDTNTGGLFQKWMHQQHVLNFLVEVMLNIL